MSEVKPKYPRFQDPKINNPPPKRKKNAPDRPQPAWLFPPDAENPILNPKPKSDEKLQREAKEREKSLDYMKRRVHAVPDRPAPPPELLTLVGAFLTEYGFNSTSRLFTNERKARQVLNGWEDALGKKLERDCPSLEKIYQDFHRKRPISKTNETSSSSSDDEENSDGEGSDGQDSDESLDSKEITKTINKDKTNSESGSTSNSDDDGPGSKTAATKAVPSPSTSSSSTSDSEEGMSTKSKSKSNKKRRVSSRSSSSSSSSSDSDADDEREPAEHKAASRPNTKQTTNSLKRKASPSSLDTSPSSDSSDNKRPTAKKTKITTTATTTTNSLPDGSHLTKDTVSTKEDPLSSSNSSSSEAPSPSRREGVSYSTLSKPARRFQSSSPTSSSDSEASSSDSQTGVGVQDPSVASVRNLSAESTSSATISGDAIQRSRSGSSSSTSGTSGSEPDIPPVAKKEKSHKSGAVQKQKGARPTPLAAAAQSAVALNEIHPSNKYVPYNYADRAYNDLSVTRGKNFTKEKNKKKRGSYRGGTIDTSSGKGFRFED